MKKILPLLLASLTFLLTNFAFAEYSADLSINPTDIIVPTDIIEGQSIRIYARINNNADKDLVGVVKFYNEKSASFIGTDQPISAIKKGTDDVFVDWKATSVGNHDISVRIIPWDTLGDNPNNNKVTKTIYVDRDFDQDGIGDRNDTDDDNDGVLDAEDAFPLDPKESKDTDKDGIGDNQDEDDDGDGMKDIEDIFPQDATETKDTDGDGVGDNKDKFPNNANESKDTDEDGLGDNEDPDSKNHGPIPYIETKSSKVAVGETVTFNALKSRDPDGQVVDYEWILGDGTEKTGVVADHVYKKRGDYKVVLKIMDDKNEPREQEMIITVGYKWQTIALLATTGLLLLLVFGFAFFSKKDKESEKKQTTLDLMNETAKTIKRKPTLKKVNKK